MNPKILLVGIRLLEFGQRYIYSAYIVHIYVVEWNKSLSDKTLITFRLKFFFLNFKIFTDILSNPAEITKFSTFLKLLISLENITLYLFQIGDFRKNKNKLWNFTVFQISMPRWLRKPILVTRKPWLWIYFSHNDFASYIFSLNVRELIFSQFQASYSAIGELKLYLHVCYFNISKWKERSTNKYLYVYLRSLSGLVKSITPLLRSKMPFIFLFKMAGIEDVSISDDFTVGSLKLLWRFRFLLFFENAVNLENRLTSVSSLVRLFVTCVLSPVPIPVLARLIPIPVIACPILIPVPVRMQGLGRHGIRLGR